MEQKKSKTGLIVSLITILVLILVTLIVLLIVGTGGKKKDAKDNDDNKGEVKESAYKMKGNDLENFDLSFLKMENKEENKIYSPLSIKYALAMLNEGAGGDSKDQITAVIGDYNPKKYNNSKKLTKKAK